MTPKRIEILGVPVDCVTSKQALVVVKAMLQGNNPEQIIAVNPEKIMKARENPVLLHQLTRSGLLIPDGIGVVWAARLLHAAQLERVPGAELMPMICGVAAQEGHKIFLFGASSSVNQRAVEVLRAQIPGIKVVGHHHGFVEEKDYPELVQEINDSQADIVFVAIGSPKQEEWMEQNLPKLNVKVCQGVGGTFDVLAGNVRRAPPIFRRCHLEWLYRLLAQPKRAFRQVALLQFAYRVFQEKVLLDWKR